MTIYFFNRYLKWKNLRIFETARLEKWLRKNVLSVSIWNTIGDHVRRGTGFVRVMMQYKQAERNTRKQLFCYLLVLMFDEPTELNGLYTTDQVRGFRH